MYLVLFSFALAVVSLPILAIVLVKVASAREDRAWSLGGPASGRVDLAARRLVDFHHEGPWPEPKNRAAPQAIARAGRQAAHSDVILSLPALRAPREKALSALHSR